MPNLQIDLGPVLAPEISRLEGAEPKGCAEVSAKILEELKAIKEDLQYIKEHMVDIDTVLTIEEENILNNSLKEHREGKTTSLEEFERELHE